MYVRTPRVAVASSIAAVRYTSVLAATKLAVSMRQLAYNEFNPIPASTASRNVRDTFAMARGCIPESSLLSALANSMREFSSFSGKPHDFMRAVHDGSVIVFFYKPVCAPCEAIRAKMLHSVTDTLHRLEGVSSSSSSGETSKKDESHSHHDCHSGSITATPTTTTTTTDNSSSSGNSNNHVDAHSASGPSAGTAAEGDDEDVPTEFRMVCERAQKRFEEEFSDAAKHIHMLSVNTDQNERLTALHDVRSLPTFVGYSQGRILGRVEGANEEELIKLLRIVVESTKNSESEHASENSS